MKAGRVYRYRCHAAQLEQKTMNETTCHNTYKYRLKPTPTQARAVEMVLWRCRDLYNAGLEERKAAYERCGVSVNFTMQSAQVPAIKVECPEYREVNAQVLQEVLHRLEKAFQAFFRRVQAGKAPGYPRFQGRERYHSFTYPQMGGHGGARLDNGYLVLSKIGRIAVRWHRPLYGTPKTVTISREADGWYACISCAEVPVEPLPPTGRETGIDVGLKVFLITAEGEVVENPRHYRHAEKQIARAQRRVSRRKKGSTRRRKAVALLRRKQQKVKRQRTDFHHTTALLLVRGVDTIYIEDLQVANMVRNRHLAKSISDVGWAAFRTILACKAECAGKRAVAVPPAYTSQDCSGCGERVPKSLSVRTHICPSCGLVLDRDENAALNILQLGRQRSGAGQAPQALTWPGGASVA
jgi:putative transposase